MLKVTYRFEAHDGKIFPIQAIKEEDIHALVTSIWEWLRLPSSVTPRVKNLPYQLVDNVSEQLVLRFSRSLPSWILSELDSRAAEAIAWAVLARHEKETWVIHWVIPIFFDGSLGQRYVYGDELRIDAIDMRLIQ